MSSVPPTVTYAGNGQFNVDGRTIPLGDLRYLVQVQSIETYNTQLADQYSEVKQANEDRKVLNELLAKMRDAKTNGDTSSNTSVTINGTSQSYSSWASDYGVDINVTGKNKGEKWSNAIEAVKSAIDSISSNSELFMLRLNNITNKLQVSSQEASTGIKTQKDNIVTILQNMR